MVCTNYEGEIRSRCDFFAYLFQILKNISYVLGAWSHLNEVDENKDDNLTLVTLPGNKNIPSNSSVHYNSKICTWSSAMKFVEFGPLAEFNEGYRKAASNTIVIGHHLAKLANIFEENVKEKGKFHCIGMVFEFTLSKAD